MSKIPTQIENPNGLHGRYYIQKIVKKESEFMGLPNGEYLALEPVDKDAEYFVMRLDHGGKDRIHIEACRKAVLHYAELIKDHLPELSKDLISRYGS